MAVLIGAACAFCTLHAWAEEGSRALPSVTAKEDQLSFMQKVFVKVIKIKGNTVFSTGELSTITARYENREITSDELERLRQEITLSYVNRGYVSSGVIIPDQQVADGVIELQAIEGKLTEVEVKGLRYFSSSYIEERLFRAVGEPVNIYRLQEALLLLQQDDRIKKINAEFKPGVKTGDSILVVHVEERFPLKLGVELSNVVPPGLGDIRARIIAEYKNVTGHGDIFTAAYGPVIGHDKNYDLDFSYLYPLTRFGTTIGISYKHGDSTIVEEPFQDLSIKASVDTYDVTLRQPIIQRFDRELAVGLSMDYRRSQTSLLDIPFTFEPGAEEGRTVAAPIRFFQEYFQKSQRQIIFIRSALSLGTDVADVTVNDQGPDARFLSWLGRLRWTRRIAETEWQLFFRADIQLAADPLLSMEKMSIGGLDTVRGFRENWLMGDNGYAASLELRIPLLEDRVKDCEVQLVPFFDYGDVRNKGGGIAAVAGPLGSMGIGLRGRIANRMVGEFFYGIPVTHLDRPSKSNLQDQGLHFRFTLNAW
jgi:hemolysin activation/secretion protein